MSCGSFTPQVAWCVSPRLCSSCACVSARCKLHPRGHLLVPPSRYQAAGTVDWDYVAADLDSNDYLDCCLSRTCHARCCSSKFYSLFERRACSQGDVSWPWEYPQIAPIAPLITSSQYLAVYFQHPYYPTLFQLSRYHPAAPYMPSKAQSRPWQSESGAQPKHQTSTCRKRQFLWRPSGPAVSFAHQPSELTVGWHLALGNHSKLSCLDSRTQWLGPKQNHYYADSCQRCRVELSTANQSIGVTCGWVR